MMPFTIDKKIIQRFDVQGPRYTSYPTAPAWHSPFSQEDYQKKLQKFSQSDKTLSLYIHIPFCQAMCTYCACSVVIRNNDTKFGDEYIDYLIREMDLIVKHIGLKKRIKQFHWGGGTPTFLNTEQISRLFKAVDERFDLDFTGEIAIEIDPRTINKTKINSLKQLGFNRISFGVQDFSPNVQEAINRIQPYELVAEAYHYCRNLGFDSVNFDLIYGLPNQTPESFQATIDKVIALKPDRVALYSFAYVPWLKKHQQKINQSTLPENGKKLEIFLSSREAFVNGGYEAIAMDHFALKNDELAKAFYGGNLYRNFMGYTVKPADDYIGLGMTSIGFLEKTFTQNAKTLPDYYAKLDKGLLPVERGKTLSDDDQIRQWTINCFMCQFCLNKAAFREKFNLEFDVYYQKEMDSIRQCQQDGLIESNDASLQVTELGKIFIRNICMHFDQYLQPAGAGQNFSKTI